MIKIRLQELQAFHCQVNFRFKKLGARLFYGTRKLQGF